VGMTKWQHYLNALERAHEGFIFLGGDDLTLKVYNPDTGMIYDVELEGDTVFQCSCPHSYYRECCCKHMVFVTNVYPYLEIDDLLKIDMEW
jgi:hypothetical protein